MSTKDGKHEPTLVYSGAGFWPTRVLPPLKCPGVGRDAENAQSLCFYFNRRVSDDEMRFLHDVMQRAVALVKETR